MGRAEQFAAALQRLESDRDLDAFLGQFDAGVELLRPEPGSVERGLDGARRFWQAYLDQFEQVGSQFTRVADGGSLSELEWTSEGTLATGRPIRYAGVSLLEHGDGRITRFSTYYDTAAFIAPAEQGAG